jgi:hypothetical protein
MPSVAKFFHSSPEFHEQQEKNREKAEKARARRAAKAAEKAANKKGPTKKAKTGPSASSSNVQSHVSDVDAPDDEPDPPAKSIAYIHVHIPPPPASRIGKKSAKAPAPQIRVLGPFTFDSATTYDEFLGLLAKTTPCKIKGLVHPKIQWKFEKPANGQGKPLSNSTGFDAMMLALEEKTKERVVVVSMPPPIEIEEPKVRNGVHHWSRLM